LSKKKAKEKIISIPGISDKNLKRLISDLKELGEKLNIPGFKETIESILKAALKGQFPLHEIRTSIKNIFSETVAEVIVFVLDDNDISFLKKLRNTDAPKEVIDFLEHITIKYGFFFDDFQMRMHYPNEVSSMHVTHYYNFDRMELVLKTSFFTRELKTFDFEAPAYSYLWFVYTLLNHISEAYSEAKEAGPNIKIFKATEGIKKIRKSIEKMESLLLKHPIEKRAKM
jgi:hypothetical protein